MLIGALSVLQRPPSSSLSYTGHPNDDVRSPGSVGGTPGPLSQPPGSQQGLDHSDPGKLLFGHWSSAERDALVYAVELH